MSYSLLFVDDEEDILELFQDIAEDEDGISSFLTATSGEAAFEIFQKSNVDILISDMNMPGKIDGVELLVKIVDYCKEQKIDPPRFYLATGDNDFTDEFVQSKGGVGVIVKPFDIIEVIEKVVSDFSKV